MNPEMLLKHFDRLCEAPGAIPRLRRFILDLAVRGKLVEQDPSDEPASELLKTIQAEKARLVKNGTVKRQDALPFIDENEIPFTLPSSWIWTRLGEAFLYDAGIKREPGELEARQWLLELEDIEKDTSVVLTRMRVQDRESRSTKSEFQAEDILYGKLRPYLNKVLVADTLGYSTTEIVAIRPFIPLCAKYCCLALRRSDFVEYVDRLGQGTKMPRLRTPDALMALFPLPPLAEQRRIVAKVDELTALCDRLKAAQAERERRRDRLNAASLQRLNASADAEAFREHARFHLCHLSRLTVRPEQLEQVREVIMNLAVQGKLVPQDASDRPVAAELAITDAVRQTVAKTDRRADADCQTRLATEAQWDIPSSWEWRGLADLTLFIDYRGHTPVKVEHGVRLITAKNVRKGFVSLSPEEFMSEETYKVWMTRGFPSSGDVLFTTEAPMGNAAVVRLTGRFALAQRVICLRPYGAIDPDFLALQINAEPFQSILDLTGTGLTAKGIKAAKLKRLPVPIPPMKEQHRIVTKVNELMELCDMLYAKLTATTVQSRRLIDTVLQEALKR